MSAASCSSTRTTTALRTSRSICSVGRSTRTATSSTANRVAVKGRASPAGGALFCALILAAKAELPLELFAGEDPLRRARRSGIEPQVAPGLKLVHAGTDLLVPRLVDRRVGPLEEGEIVVQSAESLADWPLLVRHVVPRGGC